MTREEQLNQAAEDYRNFRESCGVNNPIMLNEIEEAYYQGIKWADKNPKQLTFSAADRGIIDEIIFALNALGKEKMISYSKEIEFLNKIRKL